MTDEQLLEKQKKIKSEKILTALILGVFLGLAFYNVVNGGSKVFLIFSLLFIPMYMRSERKKKALHEEIGRRNLKFFKPIWSGYNVIDLVDYKYALVAGNNTDYLWILSKETTIPENIKQRFLKKSKDLGFKNEELIWVNHDKK